MQDKDFILLKNFTQASARGLYVHVPFCTNRCDYCAFYKKDIAQGDFALYIKSAEKELSLYPEFFPTSIFIGGGTPSALPLKYLRELLELLKGKASKSCTEFSVEVSPTSINADKLKLMQDFGVNRISMGVQSFNENLLKSLGRRTQLSQIYKAIEAISNANFEHFNMDFIFAIEGESLGDLESDLSKAISLPIDHLSAYCIEYESGTALCAGLGDRQIDESKEVEFVEFTSDFLAQHDFARYEISNFAKNDAMCAHNLGTWNMNEWVGIGASAASQYKNKRYKNIQNFNLWADKISESKKAFCEEEILDDAELLLSSIIFGLRLIDGFNFDLAQKRFAKADAKRHLELIKKLSEKDLLSFENGILKLSKKGLLLADAIALEFV